VDGSGRGLIYGAIQTEKTMKELKEDSQFSVRDVDLRVPECDAGVPTFRRQVSTGAAKITKPRLMYPH
jgi:hypothetical protein